MARAHPSSSRPLVLDWTTWSLYSLVGGSDRRDVERRFPRRWDARISSGHRAALSPRQRAATLISLVGVFFPPILELGWGTVVYWSLSEDECDVARQKGPTCPISMKILRGMKNDKNKEDECDVARRKGPSPLQSMKNHRGMIRTTRRGTTAGKYWLSQLGESC